MAEKWKRLEMAKTIFMIHGMWGGAWYWDKFQSYFEDKGYRCIEPYLRHHNIKPDDPPTVFFRGKCNNVLRFSISITVANTTDWSAGVLSIISYR
jgi:pimeloyl-ACP methyl ester carboxylesterase